MNQISTASTPDDLATLLNSFHSFIHSLMNETTTTTTTTTDQNRIEVVC